MCCARLAVLPRKLSSLSWGVRHYTESILTWRMKSSARRRVDLFAKDHPEKTDSLNAIGVFSPFHESYGYYADPVDEKTATLPKGWRGRLVNLPPGDTEGVRGLCLDPHDLAIAKYVAARPKDIQFNRQLVARKLLDRHRLLHLLAATPVDESTRSRIERAIESDFGDT